MKVVPYEERYYKDLLAFSQKIWPHKSEKYMEYRLRRIPRTGAEAKKNFLVLNDAGEIVGCNLFFPTRAMIGGSYCDVVWNHDTYVEKEYRGDAGLELTLRVNAVENMFGKGLSEINCKIHRKLKTNFIAEAKLYWVLNFWSLKLPFYKFGILKPGGGTEITPPRKIRTGLSCFERVESVDELKIPNDGFWFGADIGVDFIRDAHFLRERFFDNFNRYYLYRRITGVGSDKDDCYFVVRKIVIGNYPVLSLVDFRFDLKNPRQYKDIIRAASAIARHYGLPVTLLESTVILGKYTSNQLIYRSKTKIQVITNLRKLACPDMITTAADSDSDFLK